MIDWNIRPVARCRRNSAPAQRCSAASPRGFTLGEEGLREHRHPVKECLPTFGAEGEPRRTCHRYRDNGSGDKNRPLRGCDQHDSETATRIAVCRSAAPGKCRDRSGRIGIRSSVPPISAAVRKPFCPTSVLMSTRGNRAPAPDRTDGRRCAHDRQIGQQADRNPADESDGIGKFRQHGCDEQERRRIMPGKIADKILAQQRHLDLFLDVPIVSCAGCPSSTRRPAAQTLTNRSGYPCPFGS